MPWRRRRLGYQRGIPSQIVHSKAKIAQTPQNFNAAGVDMSRVRSTQMGPRNTSSPLALNVGILVGTSSVGIKGLNGRQGGGLGD